MNEDQGRRKQSADGQAQLDGGGEVDHNSRAKRAAKFWTLLAIFSYPEGTSASNWELPNFSLAILNVSFICVRTYVHTLPNFATAVQSGNETTQKSNGPAMAGTAGPVLAPMTWM